MTTPCANMSMIIQNKLTLVQYKEVFQQPVPSQCCRMIENWKIHDDIIKWKHFPRYWPFVREFSSLQWISPQRPVMQSFDVFFDLILSKRLSKQWWGWWFETPSIPLWRHCNGFHVFQNIFSATRVLWYIIYYVVSFQVSLTVDNLVLG